MILGWEENVSLLPLRHWITTKLCDTKLLRGQDKKDLVTKLREMLESLTYEKLLETSAVRSENIMKQLKHIPVINGKAIFMG